jgi:predicted RNase H-like nuclease (RuvC/YqgF family)
MSESSSDSFEFEMPSILSEISVDARDLRFHTPPTLAINPCGRGNFEVEELQDRISELEQQISDLRLVNAEERLKYETEIVSLRSEIQLHKYQRETLDSTLESKDEEISALQHTVQLLKDKLDIMHVELVETKAIREPEENYRLRTHLTQVISDRDSLLAELAAARAVLTTDGNTQLVLSIVKDREKEITNLKAQTSEYADTIKLLQNELHETKFAKKDVEQDLKLLLNQRSQVQALKSQLLAIKENKQTAQILDN